MTNNNRIADEIFDSGTFSSLGKSRTNAENLGRLGLMQALNYVQNDDSLRNSTAVEAKLLDTPVINKAYESSVRDTYTSKAMATDSKLDAINSLQDTQVAQQVNANQINTNVLNQGLINQMAKNNQEKVDLVSSYPEIARDFLSLFNPKYSKKTYEAANQSLAEQIVLNDQYNQIENNSIIAKANYKARYNPLVESQFDVLDKWEKQYTTELSSLQANRKGAYDSSKNAGNNYTKLLTALIGLNKSISGDLSKEQVALLNNLTTQLGQEYDRNKILEDQRINREELLLKQKENARAQAELPLNLANKSADTAQKLADSLYKRAQAAKTNKETTDGKPAEFKNLKEISEREAKALSPETDSILLQGEALASNPYMTTAKIASATGTLRESQSTLASAPQITVSTSNNELLSRNSVITLAESSSNSIEQGAKEAIDASVRGNESLRPFVEGWVSNNLNYNPDLGNSAIQGIVGANGKTISQMPTAEGNLSNEVSAVVADYLNSAIPEELKDQTKKIFKEFTGKDSLANFSVEDFMKLGQTDAAPKLKDLGIDVQKLVDSLSNERGFKSMLNQRYIEPVQPRPDGTIPNAKQGFYIAERPDGKYAYVSFDQYFSNMLNMEYRQVIKNNIVAYAKSQGLDDYAVAIDSLKPAEFRRIKDIAQSNSQIYEFTIGQLLDANLLNKFLESKNNAIKFSDVGVAATITAIGGYNQYGNTIMQLNDKFAESIASIVAKREMEKRLNKRAMFNQTMQEAINGQ